MQVAYDPSPGRVGADDLEPGVPGVDVEWMPHVREVTNRGMTNGRERTHWVVDGPLGVPVAWDAVTTQLVPDQEIAWKSVEGAAVGHAGVLRLAPTADGATRVDVQLSYNPPAGVVGHAVAAFFGRDPKRQMDDDLARLKTTIETGVPPHDAARPEAQTAARVTSSPAPEPGQAPGVTG